MNRSILVVICDFIILSMFALNSIGPDTPSQPSAAPLPVAEAAAPDESRKNTGEELQKVREERQILERALKNTIAELNAERARLAEVGRDAKYWRQREGEAMRKLGESEKKVSESTGRLNEYRVSLSVQEKELINALEKLEKSVSDLGKQTVQAEGYRKKLGEYEVGISFVNGKLSTIERELAETKGKLSRTSRSLSSREIELGENRRQSEHLRVMLQTAVNDLSREKKDNEEKTRKLFELNKLVAEAVVRAPAAPRNDVFSAYADAAMKLEVVLREGRLFNDFVGGGEYYLPALSLGSADYLALDFRRLTGNAENRSSFNRVVEYLLKAQVPGGGPAAKLPGPIFSVKTAPAVGLVPIKLPADRKALKVMTISELKKRGAGNLYLFKPDTHGKDSALLDGRCSIGMEGKNSYLYIRNATRGSAAALRAEIGDFILTGDGEFAGIVIDVEHGEFGRVQEAQCFVFPDQFTPDKLNSIDIGSTDGDGVHKIFAEQAGKILGGLQTR